MHECHFKPQWQHYAYHKHGQIFSFVLSRPYCHLIVAALIYWVLQKCFSFQNDQDWLSVKIHYWIHSWPYSMQTLQWDVWQRYSVSVANRNRIGGVWLIFNPCTIVIWYLYRTLAQLTDYGLPVTNTRGNNATSHSCVFVIS